jgi:hypothetical protein
MDVVRNGCVRNEERRHQSSREEWSAAGEE